MFFVKLLLRKLFLINWYISQQKWASLTEKQSSKIKTEMTSTGNIPVSETFPMEFVFKILN